MKKISVLLLLLIALAGAANSSETTALTSAASKCSPCGLGKKLGKRMAKQTAYLIVVEHMPYAKGFRKVTKWISHTEQKRVSKKCFMKSFKRFYKVYYKLYKKSKGQCKACKYVMPIQCSCKHQRKTIRNARVQIHKFRHQMHHLRHKLKDTDDEKTREGLRLRITGLRRLIRKEKRIVLKEKRKIRAHSKIANRSFTQEYKAKDKLSHLRHKEHSLRRRMSKCMSSSKRRLIMDRIRRIKVRESDLKRTIKRNRKLVHHPRGHHLCSCKSERKMLKRSVHLEHKYSKKITALNKSLREATTVEEKRDLKFRIKESKRMFRHYKKEVKKATKLIGKKSKIAAKVLHREHRHQRKLLHSTEKLKILETKLRTSKDGLERDLLIKRLHKIRAKAHKLKKQVHHEKKAVKHPGRVVVSISKEKKIIRRVHHLVTKLEHKKRTVRFQVHHTRDPERKRELKHRLHKLENKIVGYKRKIVVEKAVIRRKRSVVMKFKMKVEGDKNKLKAMRARKRSLERKLKKESSGHERRVIKRKIQSLKKKLFKKSIKMYQHKKQMKHPSKFRKVSRRAAMEKKLRRRRVKLVKRLKERKEAEDRRRRVKAKVHRCEKKIKRSEKKVKKTQRKIDLLKHKISHVTDSVKSKYLKKKLAHYRRVVKGERTKIRAARKMEGRVKKTMGRIIPCKAERRHISHYSRKIKRIQKKQREMLKIIKTSVDKLEVKKYKYLYKESKSDVKSCKKHIRSEKSKITKKTFLAKRLIAERSHMRKALRKVHRKEKKLRREIRKTKDIIKKKELKIKMKSFKLKEKSLKKKIHMKQWMIKHPGQLKKQRCPGLQRRERHLKHSVHTLEKKVYRRKHILHFTKNPEKRKELVHSIHKAKRDIRRKKLEIKQTRKTIARNTEIIEKNLQLKKSASKKVHSLEKKRLDLKKDLVRTTENKERMRLVRKISKLGQRIHKEKSIVRKSKERIRNPSGKEVPDKVKSAFQKNGLKRLNHRIDRLRNKIEMKKGEMKLEKDAAKKQGLKREIRSCKREIKSSKREIKSIKKNLEFKSAKIRKSWNKVAKAEKKISSLKERSKELKIKIKHAAHTWQKKAYQKKLSVVKKKIVHQRHKIQDSEHKIKKVARTTKMSSDVHLRHLDGGRKFAKMEFKLLKKKVLVLESEIKASKSLQMKRRLEKKSLKLQSQELAWRKRELHEEINHNLKLNKSVHSLKKKLHKCHQSEYQLIKKVKTFNKETKSIAKKELASLISKASSASGVAKKSLELKIQRKQHLIRSANVGVKKANQKERRLRIQHIKETKILIATTKSKHVKRSLKEKLLQQNKKLATFDKKMIKKAEVKKVKLSQKLVGLSKELGKEEKKLKQADKKEAKAQIRLRIVRLNHEMKVGKQTSHGLKKLIAREKRDLQSMHKLKPFELKAISKKFEYKFKAAQSEAHDAITEKQKRKASKTALVNKKDFYTWRIKYVKAQIAKKKAVGKKSRAAEHKLKLLRQKRRKTVHKLVSVSKSQKRRIARKIQTLKTKAKSLKGAEKEVAEQQIEFLKQDRHRCSRRIQSLKKKEKSLYKHRVQRLEQSLIGCKSHKKQKQLVKQIKKLQKSFLKLERKEIRELRRDSVKKKVRVAILKRKLKAIGDKVLATKEAGKGQLLKEEYKKVAHEMRRCKRVAKAEAEKASVEEKEEAAGKANKCGCCAGASQKYKGAITMLKKNVSQIQQKYINLLTKTDGGLLI